MVVEGDEMVRGRSGIDSEKRIIRDRGVSDTMMAWRYKQACLGEISHPEIQTFSSAMDIQLRGRIV